jgi:predicted nucleic acid-binding protein
MILYLDTSALVKEYHDEEGSMYVHEIYRRAKEGKEKLFTSLWSISETINVLDKHKMRRELTDEEFEIVIGAIFSDILDLKERGALEVIEVETDLVKMSWEMIIKEHLSSADALHLVTALNKKVNRFLAADSKLVKVAKKKGLQAINVEEVSTP